MKRRPEVKWPPNDIRTPCGLVAVAILAAFGAGVWAVIDGVTALARALST